MFFILKKTKLKGNLLVLDKKIEKQVRSRVEPSSVINLNIKKWKNWKTKNQKTTIGNDLQITENINKMEGKPSLCKTSGLESLRQNYWK